ncbi:unnamed protein product [Caenorhabditis auriculariae]|uniref:PNPLA domain-containing protein n=1 Tax=Caenorhabditis auriculariae TaxID=2777116 RepID=A0A8S1I005_9PELO|nr:unnamed protein product [Caenorhabditis auriculariae]
MSIAAQRHSRYLLSRCSNPSTERSFFNSANFLGGASSVPGTSSPPANTVPTSYSYLSDMLKSIATKIEAPLSYIGTVKKQQPPVISKAEAVRKSIETRTSRTEVSKKTRAIVKKMLVAETVQSRILRIQQLSEHIMAFPPTRVLAAQEPRLVADLFRAVLQSTDETLRQEARMCLTLIGYQPPPRSRGVNVLTIDGGGTRGMMGLEVLEAIERMSGKKINELFDLICGVSTGGILAALFSSKMYTVKECREIYMEISQKLFSQGKFQGGYGLLTSHSYYNTTLWMSILKEIIGNNLRMIDTSKALNAPRLAIVASIVNFPTMQPFIFRNYEHPAGRDSHYRGGAEHPLWTAVQASAAAPLYFEEVKLGNFLLQDGGVFANNPSAIAMHEAKLIWPTENIHCVVSVGNGRSVLHMDPPTTVMSTSFQSKLMRIIDSATDTEAVHMCMHDMLDQSVYYRFNPYMTFSYGLDEIQKDRLVQMQNDAKLYVRRNSLKIEAAALRLTQEPTLWQRAQRSFTQFKDLNGYYSPQ